MDAAAMGAVVSGKWLAKHLDDVRIVDVRWYLDGRSGRAAYDAGHIPGAVWLDMDADLAAPASAAEGRHPLPAPADFAAALGRVGIAAGTPVVAYDDMGGSRAARLWWLLHTVGEPVAVLDGGLSAWPERLVTDYVDVARVERDPVDWPAGRFVTADQVAAASGSAIVDARTAERYARGDAAIDPRPGHIPRAVCASWEGNLDEDGRFRSPEALRARFAALGTRPVIAYCGSGVTACHDLLAMHLAGLDDTALYPGSWSQWGADESRPTETS